MSDDLIARLEGLAANMRGAFVHGAETPAEAAAEITRLQARLAAAEKLAEAAWKADQWMKGDRGYERTGYGPSLRAALSTFQEGGK